MIFINLQPENPLSFSCADVPLSLMEAVRDLSANEPERKRRAIVYLRARIELGADISPALSFLEKELFNDDHGVRNQVLETLRAYALSMYKVDITAAMRDFLVDDGHDVDYPLTEDVVSTALVHVNRKKAEKENGSTHKAKQRSIIHLPSTQNSSHISLFHLTEDEPAEQISGYQESVPADAIGLLSGSINDVNMASAVTVNRVGRKVSRSSFAAAMILAIIMMVIVSLMKYQRAVV